MFALTLQNDAETALRRYNAWSSGQAPMAVFEMGRGRHVVLCHGDESGDYSMVWKKIPTSGEIIMVCCHPAVVARVNKSRFAEANVTVMGDWDTETAVTLYERDGVVTLRAADSAHYDLVGEMAFRLPQ